MARQEAKSSAQEARYGAQQAKMSTVIAFVAMLFLPMTTTAVSAPHQDKTRGSTDPYQQTIFAMPVFQFSNNWRDWRYHQVNKGDSSGSNSTTTTNFPDPPVFSGYFWIYLGISIALTMITIEGWWRFTQNDIGREKGQHWSRYLARKLWVYIR